MTTALSAEQADAASLGQLVQQSDLTGRMLLVELERAAKRGVRVRLLFDDNGIAALTAPSPRSPPSRRSTCAV